MHVQRLKGNNRPNLVRISGCICQTEASTGRLAMNNVNLQNVPKPMDFEVPPTQMTQMTLPSQQPDLLRRAHTANIRWASLLLVCTGSDAWAAVCMALASCFKKTLPPTLPAPLQRW